MPTNGNNFTDISTWDDDSTFVYSPNNAFISGDVGGYLTITGGTSWTPGVYAITAIFLNFSDSSFPNGIQNIVKLTAQDGSTPVFPTTNGVQATGGIGSYSATLSGPPQLIAGATTVSSAANGITISVAVATGGTAPYTYEAERSLNKQFGTTDTGVTSLGVFSARTRLDPVSNLNVNYVYWFRWKITDANNTIVYSNIKPATIPVIQPTPGAAIAGRKVVVLGIGDSNYSTSISANNTDLGTRIAEILETTYGITDAISVNRAVGSTGPIQWQQGATENLLEPAIDAGLAAYNAISGTNKILYVEFNHGTNYIDLPSTYITLVSNIVNRCIARGINFVLLSGSIFLQPANGGVSGNTEHREFLMRDYRSLLSTLDNGTTISVGDQWTSYKETGIFPNLVTNDDNIHLNNNGIESSAQIRARYAATRLSQSQAPSNAITAVDIPIANPTIPIGGGIRLTANVTGSGSYDQTVTWSENPASNITTLFTQSDNSVIVIADPNANAGTVNIRATSNGNTSLFDSITITVEDTGSQIGQPGDPVTVAGLNAALNSRGLTSANIDRLLLISNAFNADGTEIDLVVTDATMSRETFYADGFVVLDVAITAVSDQPLALIGIPIELMFTAPGLRKPPVQTSLNTIQAELSIRGTKLVARTYIGIPPTLGDTRPLLSLAGAAEGRKYQVWLIVTIANGEKEFQALPNTITVY